MKKTPPKISIVIPIYNSEFYLKACLDSCLNQTFKDFEVVAVNDGSPDRCADILDQYARLDSRIKIVHKENEGLVAARKTGVSHAGGEYLFFLDSDDTVPPSALEDLITETKDCDLIIGNLDVVATNGKLLHRIKNNNPFDADVEGILSAIVSKNIVGSLCGRLIKRALWQRSNMDSSFSIGEDFITNLQICALPVTVKYVDKSAYHYIQYKGSMLNTAGEKTANARLKYIEWVLDFMPFHTTRPQTDDAVALFAIEEYFSYLRDGGRLNNCVVLTSQINNVYLHNHFALTHIASWRLMMVQMYKKAPLLGKLYRFVFVKLRNLVRR